MNNLENLMKLDLNNEVNKLSLVSNSSGTRRGNNSRESVVGSVVGSGNASGSGSGSGSGNARGYGSSGSGNARGYGSSGSGNARGYGSSGSGSGSGSSYRGPESEVAKLERAIQGQSGQNRSRSLANSNKSSVSNSRGIFQRVKDYSSGLSLGNVILALFFIYLLINLVYITSETYRVGSVIVELNKYSLNYAVDYRYLYQEGRQEKLFKNFYVATAFRPYLGKNQLLDYTSDRILLQTIKSGPRAIYVDIFNDTLSDDAFPVVSSGFEKGNWRLTLTTMSFDKFCQTLAKSVFTSGFVNNYDDPFILILNLKTNKNFKCHNRIQETLFKYFKSRLLPSKFSYGKGDLLNTPMRELMGKVIIMTSGGYENSKLEEIVNFSLERDDFHKISFASLVDEVSSYDNVKLNMDDVRTQMRDNLGLVVPKELSFFTRNYNPQNFFDTGCQMIAMNYQKVDKYMETYFTKFQGSSFVEKPKGLQGLA